MRGFGDGSSFTYRCCVLSCDAPATILLFNEPYCELHAEDEIVKRVDDKLLEADDD